MNILYRKWQQHFIQYKYFSVLIHFIQKNNQLQLEVFFVWYYLQGFDISSHLFKQLFAFWCRQIKVASDVFIYIVSEVNITHQLCAAFFVQNYIKFLCRILAIGLICISYCHCTIVHVIVRQIDNVKNIMDPHSYLPLCACVF